MGANLGFFAEDRERDFPELNKCPDCETFFADANCPICGKECPEEFRAGNRKPIKQKKYRRSQGNGRVEFVPWYYSAWFIVLMLIFVPIVGLILMWNSHWKTHWKAIATGALVFFYLFGGIIGGFVMNLFYDFNNTEPAINLEMSEADYKTACSVPNAEALYRNCNAHKGYYLCMELTVGEISDTYYYDSEDNYGEANVYLCYVQNGDIRLEFFVADYRQENITRLAVGDKITVWGEVAGEISSGTTSNRPAIYARFIDLQ
ncbi:MAG: hypothetical protein J6V22_06705 [Clostridia bacterium]|nr:hypothetical protein [Clostridia bacterium]